MMRFLRPAFVVFAGAGVLATAGCTGRRGQVPEPAALQPYNGEWALDAVQPSREGIQITSTDGYGFTRQTSQMLVAAMGIRAERFVLELSDSIFRVSSDEPGFSYALPIDGGLVEIMGEDGEVEQSITLTWDRGTPVVRRRLPGVGLVSERFELTEDGALMVIRTAAMRNVRGNEVSAIGALAISYTRTSGSRP